MEGFIDRKCLYNYKGSGGSSIDKKYVGAKVLESHR